jgi:uncharacterized membrane protein (DUF485 family)
MSLHLDAPRSGQCGRTPRAGAAQHRRSSVSSSVDGGRSPSAVSSSAYVEVQRSEKFQELRRRHRSIAFPLAIAFLAWYFLFVLLADYAHDFMAHKLWGNITVGLVFGLLQFVSTFVITTVYVRFANKNLDPVAEEIREDLEGRAR